MVTDICINFVGFPLQQFCMVNGAGALLRPKMAKCFGQGHNYYSKWLTAVHRLTVWYRVTHTAKPRVIAPLFIVLHRCSVLFTNWGQDPPPTKKLGLAILWYSLCCGDMNPRYLRGMPVMPMDTATRSSWEGTCNRGLLSSPWAAQSAAAWSSWSTSHWVLELEMT